MKKIFFITAWLLIICTCIINVPLQYHDNSFYKIKENKDQIINNIENREFKSGKKNDELFFNLTFGMNLNEVKKEFSDLEKEKIIDNISLQNEILGASYTMNYHEYSNLGRVYCFFNDNKLNELQIDTLNQNNSNLLDLFIKKYGEVDYLAENEVNTEYHWINGNRHITIFQRENSDRLLIQYLETSERVKDRNLNILDRLGVYHKA